MAKFIEKEYKSILNKLKYIDNWFWGRYTINTYNGCQFGCTYCDARSAHYHMPADFENQIVIKQNPAEMLDKRISRARTLLPDVVVFGGVTDCYQPAEKKYEHTRRMLEVLLKHRYPVHIITKSTLVLRDLDLLEEIAQQTWCTVSVTITTMDEEVASFVDFQAPAPQKRIAVVQEIKAKAPHVQSGVLLIPLIPVLCDSDDSLRKVVSAARTAAADYLLFGGGMSLRDTQAQWFLTKLQARFPTIYRQYQDIYKFSGHAPVYEGNYWTSAEYLLDRQPKLFDLCRELGVPYRIPRWLPADWRYHNYRIAEPMLNRAYEHQMHGREWKTLFWAGQNVQQLKEPIQDVAARGELHTIRNVRGRIKDRVEEMLGE